MLEYMQSAMADHSPLAILFAFIGGLLSVATPCVLPMIPITLSTLGVSSARSRSQAILSSSLYVLGIMITFTSLGLLSGLSGGVFGAWLANTYVTLGLALLFIVLALSSFELYEIDLPQSFTEKLGRINQGKRHYTKALLMGLVAGFIAMPCLGPILAGILLVIGLTGNGGFGALLLATYSLGFGIPFFLFGVLSVNLPRRGPWMRNIKSFFGLALLLVAFWLLRNIIPSWREYSVNPILSVTILISGILIGALHRHFDASLKDKILKSVGILLFTVGASLMINYVLTSDKSSWCQGNANACLETECKNHKFTIVDFSASWCLSCHELENETLEHPLVTKALEQWGKVSIDYDQNQEIVTRFQVKGLPTLIFLDQNCQPIGTGHEGMIKPDKLIEMLQTFEQG